MQHREHLNAKGHFVLAGVMHLQKVVNTGKKAEGNDGKERAAVLQLSAGGSGKTLVFRQNVQHRN